MDAGHPRAAGDRVVSPAGRHRGHELGRGQDDRRHRADRGAAPRGDTPRAFKVGPDFIDPSYHALATGRPGPQPRRVPLRPGADRAAVRARLPRRRHRGDRGRDGPLRRRLRARRAGVHRARREAPAGAGRPRVDAAAMARSVAAIVHGYRTFDPAVNVAGVILNRVGSDAHAALLREALPTSRSSARCPRCGARGPRAPPRPRPGRRARAARARGDRAAGGERRGALRPRGARSRSPAPRPPLARRGAGSPGTHEPAAPRAVAIARGPAFSFHYEENLELLRGAGAELFEFDPLDDDALPEADALILAGGFPEVFGAELCANRGCAGDRRLRRPDPGRVRRAALPGADARRAPDVRRARCHRHMTAGSRSAIAR